MVRLYKDSGAARKRKENKGPRWGRFIIPHTPHLVAAAFFFFFLFRQAKRGKRQAELSCFVGCLEMRYQSEILRFFFDLV